MNDPIAIRCDHGGRVVELLRLSEQAPALAVGEPIDALFEPGSRRKLAAFLGAIRAEGYAIGWELVVALAERQIPHHFAGARLSDTLLVLATEAPNDLLLLADELSRVTNEQTNALRDALKELSRTKPPSDPNRLYNEMSRLNSDLATAQRELARRNVRLEALNREKNELVGMAAHDLRNPLAATLTLSEHLLRETRDVLGERHLEMLEHLRSSSAHMLALVEDLLDLTALEAGTLSLSLAATDLPRLLGGAVRLARELARDKGITIDLVEDEGPPATVTAAALDPHKITQALTNLLTNAVKFSRPGGSIEVRLACDHERATIAIADHGVGIAADQLAVLFEPFTRGTHGTRGEKTTGLGLAIVRRLVRGHGGEVMIESEVGVGTTATISLPLRRMPEAPAPAPAPADRPPTRAREVLIADDDPVSRLVLRVLLEEAGHAVHEAEDARAALAALEARRFDLVIADVEMPGGGGRAISAALRARPAARPIPLIALTGHTGARAAALARGPDFDAVVSKPPVRDHLLGLIESLSAGDEPDPEVRP